MQNTNDEFISNEKAFGLRLAKLRETLGISAREMSLDIGQNKNYINSIESGKTFPSMTSFMYICNYMKITPKDFFDQNFQNPVPINDFEKIYRQLSPDQAFHLMLIAQDLLGNNN